MNTKPIILSFQRDFPKNQKTFIRCLIISTRISKRIAGKDGQDDPDVSLFIQRGIRTKNFCLQNITGCSKEIR